MNWLPDELTVNDPITEVCKAAAYAVFCRDFKQSRPQYEGLPVYHDTALASFGGGNYEEGFWHIISEGYGIRSPCHIRCKRITWVRPLIDNHNNNAVSCWEEPSRKKSGAFTIYVWLEIPSSSTFPYGHLTILSRTKNGYCKIVTAYPVSTSDTQNNLRKKRAAAQTTQ